jgi:hypothetical protein
MQSSITKKGERYLHPKFRGNWDNSVKCGSRTSNWNNSPLNLNSNKSSRGAADTDLGPNGLADHSPLSSQAKHITTVR